jgi:hypothetical protein
MAARALLNQAIREYSRLTDNIILGDWHLPLRPDRVPVSHQRRNVLKPLD